MRSLPAWILCFLGPLLAAPQLSAQTGSISASPNPCTIAAGKKTCKTTLKWSATGTTGLLVRGSHNGAAERTFASSGRSGSQSASWIQAAPAHTYTFYLYDYAGRVQGKLLDSVTVTGKAPPKPKPPPKISFFSASPTAIDKGKSSTLRWSASNVASVSISPGIGKVKPQGYRKVSPSKTTTYTLTATNSAKSVKATAKVTVRPVSAPTATISATPTSIDKGKSSTLKWSTTNATSVFISPGIGKVSASGTRKVTPSKTTTYVLTATNSIKSVKVSAKVTVRPPPSTVSGTISASPNPCQIAAGKRSCTTTLTWSATGTTGLLVRVSRNSRASTVLASSGRSGRASPSWIQAAPANSYTFSLYNYAGRVQGKLLDSVTVTGKAPAKPPKIISFRASPTRIDKGKSSTLSWSTTNADTLSIAPDVGEVTGTSIKVFPSKTTTYTLTATNSVKADAAIVKVTVVPPAPTISSFTATPTTIGKGEKSTLRWKTSNADTLSITPGIGTLTDTQRRIYARSPLQVSPTVTTTYTLKATNRVKSVTATAKVTVGPPRISGIISVATLNPCAIETGQAACTAKIQWTVKNTNSVKVYRSANGGAATLFATATGDGSRVAAGIKGSPNRYVFNLYDYSSGKRGKLLDSVTVTGRKVPTGTFTATPETIDQGGFSTLRWSTANADSVFLSPGVGKVGASGSRRVSPNSTTTYTLNVTNAARSVKLRVTVTVRKTKAPAISFFTATPAAIDKGKSTTLRWSTTDADTLSITPGIGTLTDTQRRAYAIRPLRVSPLKTTTYTLKATNRVKSVTATVTVTVRKPTKAPTIGSFTANPGAIDKGKSATLRWSTTNADTLSITPGIGTLTNDQRRTYARTGLKVSPSETTTYTLKATNPLKSVTATVTVTVRKPSGPAGTISASPNPCTINPMLGTCDTTISWTIQNTTSARVYYSLNGAKKQHFTRVRGKGSRMVPFIKGPPNEYVFSLYDYSDGRLGDVLASVTVTGQAPATGSISVSPDPCTIYHGQTGCTPTVSWQSKGATEVQVWYSLNGGEEKLLASSAGGGPHSRKLDVELKKNDRLVLKLYDYSSGTRQPLAKPVEKTLTVQEDIGCPPASN